MGDSLQSKSNVFPISVKGVVVHNGMVVLLKNERDEWELPGGRLELDEDPERCVVREVAEEIGWRVQAGPILDAWLYHIFEGREVFIVTYGCHLDAATGPPVLSAEHSEVRLFSEDEVPGSTCRPATSSPSRPGSAGSAAPRTAVMPRLGRAW
jgi:8-oxo-dGTP pyrophosphatase MutT (NUDIX family)